MTEDTGIRLAEDLLQAFNDHDIPSIARLLSDTFLAVSPMGPIGPAGWKKQTAEHFRDFPHSAWTKVRVSGNRDSFHLEVLWSTTGRARSADPDEASSIAMNGLIRGGKIETLRVEYDPESVRRQLEPRRPRAD